MSYAANKKNVIADVQKSPRVPFGWPLGTAKLWIVESRIQKRSNERERRMSEKKDNQETRKNESII